MVTSGKTRREARRGTFAATRQGYTRARRRGLRRPPRLKRGTELAAIIRRRRRQEPTDRTFAVTRSSASCAGRRPPWTTSTG